MHDLMHITSLHLVDFSIKGPFPWGVFDACNSGTQLHFRRDLENILIFNMATVHRKCMWQTHLCELAIRQIDLIVSKKYVMHLYPKQGIEPRLQGIGQTWPTSALPRPVWSEAFASSWLSCTYTSVPWEFWTRFILKNCLVLSVTRWWNQKLPIFSRYCPKSSQIIFTWKLYY